jgi:hypothetical protein
MAVGFVFNMSNWILHDCDDRATFVGPLHLDAIIPPLHSVFKLFQATPPKPVV